MPKFSHRIPCTGKIAVSPDGQFFATKAMECLSVYCFSSLKRLIEVRAPYSLKFLKFALDGKYVGWLSADPFILRLCEIQTRNILEIDVKPGLEVVALVFGPRCVIYVSELEIYLGVYDFGLHVSFTLEGCSLDDFGRPLLTFSPKGDYLCMVRGHQTIMYNADSWDPVTVFNCPVCPIVPVFVNLYTIFMTNHEGMVEWFSAFGSRIKTDSVPQSSCILGVELSKDGRKLLASTYDNKVICFDTISMESSFLFEYVYNIKPQDGVRVFSFTDVEKGSQAYLKFDESNSAVFEEVKNVMDEFKMKTQNEHLMSLNHDDTLLATIHPSNLYVVWIWDLFKMEKLRALIRLNRLSGSIKGMRWHYHTNKLAISYSNSVVIWSDTEDLVGLHGESMTFKWLNLKVPVGIVATDTNCRFACF